LAVPFFNGLIDRDTALLIRADFLNKVFALDERLPHGFVELFKDHELDQIISKRMADYHAVQEQCEQAATPEEAEAMLKAYNEAEGRKRLPYAERYIFDFDTEPDSEVIFLSFYIFLRAREMVAIKRWMGDVNYSLVDAAEDTVERVFGGMGIDLLD
jgi:hypothetical protein